MINKLTPVTAKWIGIRAGKLGKGAKMLKDAGFRREDHAQLNNVHGVDFLMPCAAKTLADFDYLFLCLRIAGFTGVAFQWTDLQWKHNGLLTKAQWQARKEI